MAEICKSSGKKKKSRIQRVYEKASDNMFGARLKILAYSLKKGV